MIMKVQATIEQKLLEGFEPIFMQVLNESHMHNVPEDAESHFKLVLVSRLFSGQKSVRRHQQVYRLLAEELQAGVHALAIHTYDPDEWSQRQQVPASPKCHGGE